jgi:hypothetical protein
MGISDSKIDHGADRRGLCARPVSASPFGTTTPSIKGDKIVLSVTEQPGQNCDYTSDTTPGKILDKTMTTGTCVDTGHVTMSVGDTIRNGENRATAEQHAWLTTVTANCFGGNDMTMKAKVIITQDTSGTAYTTACGLKVAVSNKELEPVAARCIVEITASTAAGLLGTSSIETGDDVHLVLNPDCPGDAKPTVAVVHVALVDSINSGANTMVLFNNLTTMGKLVSHVGVAIKGNEANFFAMLPAHFNGELQWVYTVFKLDFPDARPGGGRLLRHIVRTHKGETVTDSAMTASPFTVVGNATAVPNTAALTTTTTTMPATMTTTSTTSTTAVLGTDSKAALTPSPSTPAPAKLNTAPFVFVVQNNNSAPCGGAPSPLCGMPGSTFDVALVLAGFVVIVFGVLVFICGRRSAKCVTRPAADTVEPVPVAPAASAAEIAVVVEVAPAASVEGMSVVDLKALIEAAGLSHADCIEMIELRARAVEAIEKE